MIEADGLETRWPRAVGRFVLWGLLTGALYVVSIGPAIWMFVGRSEAVERAILFLYFPVWPTHDNTPLDNLLGPYCDWWATLPGGSEDRFERKRLEGPWDFPPAH